MSILGGIGKTLSNAAGLLTEPLKVAGKVVSTAVHTDLNLLKDVVTLNPKAFVKDAAHGINEQVNNLAEGATHQIDHVGGIVGGQAETLGSTVKLGTEPLRTAGHLIGNHLSGTGDAISDLADGHPGDAVGDTFQMYKRDGKILQDHGHRVLHDLVG